MPFTKNKVGGCVYTAYHHASTVMARIPFLEDLRLGASSPPRWPRHARPRPHLPLPLCTMHRAPCPPPFAPHTLPTGTSPVSCCRSAPNLRHTRTPLKPVSAPAPDLPGGDQPGVAPRRGLPGAQAAPGRPAKVAGHQGANLKAHPRCVPVFDLLYGMRSRTAKVAGHQGAHPGFVPPV